MFFFALLTISFPIIFWLGKYQKKIGTYFFILLIIYIFILSVMCTQFLVLKFTDDKNLVFPDEYLYVYDNTSILLFSYYVRFLSYINIDLVRGVNVIAFAISLSILSSEIINKVTGRYKLLVYVFSISGCIVGAYWSFFILKEAFTVTALSMLIIARIKNSRSYFIVAFLFLCFARIDLLLLYFLISLFFLIKSKSKFLYYLLFIVFGIIFFLFMNSEYSYSFKLFTLSRRFGEDQFEFDAIAINTSHLGMIPFIFSEAFLQAILTNVNSTFNPFLDFNPIVIFQRFFNLAAILVFIVSARHYLLKDKLYTFTFAIVIGLLCTHSVYRYLNSILIPLTLYFIYLLYLDKGKVAC